MPSTKNYKKISSTAIILTLLMTFMEMSGLPAALFIKIEVADITPFYFVLMVNFIIMAAVCWLWRRFIVKDWFFGLHFKGALLGVKQYGLPVIVATVIIFITLVTGLSPIAPAICWCQSLCTSSLI